MNGVWYLKDLSVLDLAPALVEILEAVQRRWGCAVITSAYRRGDKGVHGCTPCRGVDLRASDMGHDIAAWVNDGWEYDPERPEMRCALYHDAGSGWHLHLQVHPHTVKVVGDTT
jgi:hypothetical protein